MKIITVDRPLDTGHQNFKRLQRGFLGKTKHLLIFLWWKPLSNSQTSWLCAESRLPFVVWMWQPKFKAFHIDVQENRGPVPTSSLRQVVTMGSLYFCFFFFFFPTCDNLEQREQKVLKTVRKQNVLQRKILHCYSIQLSGTPETSSHSVWNNRSLKQENVKSLEEKIILTGRELSNSNWEVTCYLPAPIWATTKGGTLPFGDVACALQAVHPRALPTWAVLTSPHTLHLAPWTVHVDSFVLL